MPRRHPAAALVSACASALALAVVVTGCTTSATPTTSPSAAAFPSASGGYVSQPGLACADAVHTSDVGALLPQGNVTVREEQQPEKDYPILRCEVSSGTGADARTFTGSAYLFNTAGTGLVQLPGLIGSDAVPFGNDGNALTSGDDAFLIQECHVKDVQDTVPILVRAQLSGSPTSDHRQELASLTVQLARRVATVAGCGTSLPDPQFPPLETAATPQPVTAGARACGILDASLLNPSAGTWTAAMTNGGGPVQGCDLFLNGRPVVRFTFAYGWLAPTAEVPDERASLTERQTPPGTAGDDLPDPGTVLASVDGLMTSNVLVAYRMSRLDGVASTTDVYGTPVETMFRAFMSNATTNRKDLQPIPDNAVWTFAKSATTPN